MCNSSSVCANRCIMSRGEAQLQVSAAVLSPPSPVFACMFICMEIVAQKYLWRLCICDCDDYDHLIVCACVYFFTVCHNFSLLGNDHKTMMLPSGCIHVCAIVFYWQTVCFLFTISKQWHYLISAMLDKSIWVMRSAKPKNTCPLM